ncbi:MAG: hypothetical protein Q9218_007473 [Villophora microphyllina]
MAPTKGSRTPGAPRAGGYHVKTGCVTCKIRHVKCDEGKPECQKCLTTGRRCDGYPTKPAATIPDRTRDLVRRSVSHDPPLDTLRPSLWTGTADELRGFDYFRIQTSADLGYSLNASLEELVLQTSHQHDAIKHGAIALGWLGMLIRVNSGYSRPWNNHRPALCRYEFARTQYYKAIQTLREELVRNDKDAVNATLITCFLFIVFEFLQGNDQAAVAHLRSGLNILRKEVFPPDAKPDGPTLDKLVGKLDPMQSEIARIFHILDTQATMWLELRTSQFSTRVLPSNDSPAPPSSTLPPYSSLAEASKDLNDLIVLVQDFRFRTSQLDLNTAISPALYAERDSLLDTLEVHRRRLSTYVATRTTSATYPEDPQRITILRINRKITTIVLATCLEPNKAAFYARSMWQFWQIVSLAVIILRPETRELRHKWLKVVAEGKGCLPCQRESGVRCCGRTPAPHGDLAQTFSGCHVPSQSESGEIPPSSPSTSSLDGLIQPLYFTAVKCRERATAERAVKLLEMEPWREGEWDSRQMAEMAKRDIAGLEKMGWYEVGEGGFAPGLEQTGTGCPFNSYTV